jgi:hypothetical protein
LERWIGLQDQDTAGKKAVKMIIASEPTPIWSIWAIISSRYRGLFPAHVDTPKQTLISCSS